MVRRQPSRTLQRVEDPGEKKDLAATYPDRAEQLAPNSSPVESVNPPMPRPNPDWKGKPTECDKRLIHP